MVTTKKSSIFGKIIIYALLLCLAFLMLVPFAWMLSASVKYNKDVFSFPMKWIPDELVWENYATIWTRIPLLTFILNTFKLTIVVTILQVLTSSFAAYAFSKLHFKGRNVLFLGYIGTIDITRAATLVQSRTYDAYVPLLTAAVFYLVLVMILTYFMGKLERRLRKSDH